MDLISVIVPIYKVENYLRQCLDSLVAQTYKNIEVIMVDDGSPDKCGEICDVYAAKYSNFKAVHKENAGLGMARNTGLEYANGEYVMFLDSDDYINSDLIQVLYETVQKYRVDICKSGFQYVKNDGTIQSKRCYKNELFEGEKAATDFLPRLVGSAPDKKDSFEMSVCASLYRLSHIKEHNLIFPSERELIYEDLIFNIEYAQYANGACVVGAIGYNYRRNEKSLTKSYQSGRFDACINWYIYVKKRLLELNYGVEVIYRLDRILFVYARSCIRQERKDISGKSSKEITEKLKSICNDPTLRNAIQEYPVHKLGVRQAFFLHLIKWRAAEVLRIFAELGAL